MNKKKVLIIQELIPHYRVAFFNKLSDHFDITVTTTADFSTDYLFEIQRIKITKLGPFLLPKITWRTLSGYDVIIYSFNIRYLPLFGTLFLKKQKPIILWGIGVTTETGFDVRNKFDVVRYFYAKKADALIFYSKYAKNKYVRIEAVSQEKLFVANNTLDICPEYFECEKEYFLFVGTFKKYKRVDDVINLFNRAYQEYPSLSSFIMIGDGEYLEEAKALVKELKLQHKISFTGAINDEEELILYYKRAIASVSPYQAGLSVLQSMAKGVPFISLNNSITGGERFNIINWKNGVLAATEEDIIKSMYVLWSNPDVQKEMAYNAYLYFKENCLMENMVNSFRSAIEFTITKG